MLLSLGFRIVPTSNMVGDPLLLWSFGKPAAKEGGTYVPRPFPTDRVELTGEALELVDKLGRHTHNVSATRFATLRLSSDATVCVSHPPPSRRAGLASASLKAGHGARVSMIERSVTTAWSPSTS